MTIPEIVNMTSDAARNQKFFEITAFPFQWCADLQFMKFSVIMYTVILLMLQFHNEVRVNVTGKKETAAQVTDDFSRSCLTSCPIVQSR